MTDYDQAKIKDLAAAGLDKARSTKERGDALEDLFVYLLCELPGIAVERNTRDPFKSREIDITVGNAREARWLSLYPPVFLVECKNWDEHVGVEGVSHFAQKLRHCYLEAGVLVAANGITGRRESLTSAYQTIAMEQAQGRRIVVVTMDDLLQVTNTGDFENLLRDQYLRVVASARI
jgi:hypothetical protein